MANSLPPPDIPGICWHPQAPETKFTAILWIEKNTQETYTCLIRIEEPIPKKHPLGSRSSTFILNGKFRKLRELEKFDIPGEEIDLTAYGTLDNPMLSKAFRLGIYMPHVLFIGYHARDKKEKFGKISCYCESRALLPWVEVIIPEMSVQLSRLGKLKIIKKREEEKGKGPEEVPHIFLAYVMDLIFSKPKTIPYCEKTLENLFNFFNCFGIPLEITKVSWTPQGSEKGFPVLFVNRPPLGGRSGQLIPYYSAEEIKEELERNMETYICEWFQNKKIKPYEKSLSFALANYLQTVYYPMPGENRFLDLLITLEALHRRMGKKQTILKNEEWEPLKENIEEVIINNNKISDSQKKQLKGKLQYSHEVSLRSRVKELVEMVADKFPNAQRLKKELSEEAIEDIINLRNYYVHLTEKESIEEAQKRLEEYISTLTGLIQWCILIDLKTQ